MFHCVLFQPEIPPNTGNIIRLCANTGVALHLIHPLGFALEDRKMRRAGLDYREWAQVKTYNSLAQCWEALGTPRVFACSTKGSTLHTAPMYQPGDAFLFGPETRGLPADVLHSIPSAHIVRIPMRPNNRSLNLANAAAVILYEAWRQHEFML